MTQVKVIITKERVYTTFYKTIHACMRYADNLQERSDDPSTEKCCALAFRLAQTTPTPTCEIVNFDDRVLFNQDIFDYLNTTHEK